MRRPVSLLVLGAVALGTLGPGTAVAGGPVGGGPKGGLYYYLGTADMLPNGVSGRATICSQPGTRPIGGGFETDTGSADGQLLNSAPYDAGDSGSKPDDGWEVTAGNLRSVSATLWAYAICGPDRIRYSSDRRTIKAGKAATMKASCPRGTRVTSGGLENPIYQVQVSGTYPFDDGDRKGEPDDGWAVRAWNFGGDSARVKVWAVCAHDVKMDYIAYRATTLPGSPTSAFFGVVCSGDTFFTGGGGYQKPPLTTKNARITAMIPYDDVFDTDSVPDNRPSFEVAHPVNGGKLRYYTVCVMRPGL